MMALRASIPQPVRGRACGCMGAPVRNPRRIARKPPRCAVRARRHPARKVHRRKAAVSCRCTASAAREPDQEADLPR